MVCSLIIWFLEVVILAGQEIKKKKKKERICTSTRLSQTWHYCHYLGPDFLLWGVHYALQDIQQLLWGLLCVRYW